MSASFSSQSALEANPSLPNDTWSAEPWFLEHQDHAECFEAERQCWAAGLAPAVPSIAAQDPLWPEDATNQYDDSSSDSSSDTDSLASEETFSSERQRFEASMQEARRLADELIEHVERQRALAGEDEADDSDGGEDLQGDDGHGEQLPLYEHVETPPPDYVATITTVAEEVEPQTEEPSLRELRERERERELELEHRRQRQEEQEFRMWSADSRDAPEPWTGSYELQTFETGYERARAGRSSDDGCSSAMREDRETLEMSGGDGALGRRLL